MANAKKIALCGVLTALALVLSYVERFLPLQMLVPLPGVKLGLANIVTLIALYSLGVKEAFAILTVRCLFGAIFGGGITGLMFSMTGGVFAMSVMALAKRGPLFSVYGVSILGAAAHNIGQIAVAMVVMHSVYIGAYLPYLLVVALFTGSATGIAGAGVLRVLHAAPIFAKKRECADKKR